MSVDLFEKHSKIIEGFILNGVDISVEKIVDSYGSIYSMKVVGSSYPPLIVPCFELDKLDKKNKDWIKNKVAYEQILIRHILKSLD